MRVPEGTIFSNSRDTRVWINRHLDDESTPDGGGSDSVLIAENEDEDASPKKKRGTKITDETRKVF